MRACAAVAREFAERAVEAGGGKAPVLLGGTAPRRSGWSSAQQEAASKAASAYAQQRSAEGAPIACAEGLTSCSPGEATAEALNALLDRSAALRAAPDGQKKCVVQ